MSLNELAFSACVERHFRFLVERYGFRWLDVSAYVVRYESDKLAFTVDYDRLAVAASLRSARSTLASAVTHGTIIRHFGIDTERYGAFHASTAEALEFVVSGLAEMIEAVMPTLSAAPEASLQALERNAAEGARAYTVDAITRALLVQADSAWHDRDFPRLVAICEEQIDLLPPTYRRRYDYAKKRLARR